MIDYIYSSIRKKKIENDNINSYIYSLNDEIAKNISFEPLILK
jgi:hypothetical protein